MRKLERILFLLLFSIAAESVEFMMGGGSSSRIISRNVMTLPQRTVGADTTTVNCDIYSERSALCSGYNL